MTFLNSLTYEMFLRSFNLRAAEIDLFLLRWLRKYQQKLADRENFIYHALYYADIKV